MRPNGASVTPDIGARTTRLATSISPIFNGLSCEESGPVKVCSFFWRSLHCERRNPFCAQFLGSQGSCLHFRQFCELCKCTAAKTGFPTAIANRSFYMCDHDKGSAPAHQCSLPQPQNHLPFRVPCRNQNGLQPSLSRPAEACAPAQAARNNTARSAGRP